MSGGKQITLLDGGMGQELVRRAGKATALWSTQALIDAPQDVAAVHRDYADAGATMATSNTYALHRDRLGGGSSNHYAAAGTDIQDMQDQLEDLYTLALDAAESVRDAGRVAGSIGPLGASYRPDLWPAHEDAVRLLTEIVGFLSPRADVLLFETLPSVAAARSGVEAGRTRDLPVWLSFTVDDADGSRLRSGEPLSAVAGIAAEADAVLINCSVPEVIPAALEALAPCGVPLGAYANGFTKITEAFIAGGTTADGLTARKDLTPEVYADQAMSWLDHGATILGGCCEVGPAHIAEIARRLKAAGHTII
ncbi:MAG: homocysteine S-methyltransferase family protein [Pseudomonadota bacterium]